MNGVVGYEIEEKRGMQPRLRLVTSGMSTWPDDPRIEAATLTRVKWLLTEIDDRRPTFPNPQMRPSIGFDAEERRAAGSGGCNRFFGGYKVGAEGELKLGPVGSTKLACRDIEVARTETQFFRSLEGVTRCEIANGVLTLFAGNRPVLVFARA